MEFSLNEDQRLLGESVQGLLGEVCTLDHVRAIADGDRDAKRTMAGSIDALGLSGLLVPEADGGLGLGLLDAVVVQDAIGASVSPVGILPQMLAAYIIARADVPAAREELVSRVAEGSDRFALAMTEKVSRRDGSGIREVNDTLTGTARFAMGTDLGDIFLVLDEDECFHAVKADAAGMTVTPLRTIDRTRDFVELSFHATPALRLTEDPGISDRALEAGRVLVAADTLGACQSLLERAVAYAGERKQFGRVIGSFQAVKHLCAEMAARLEPARALVWQTAHAFDVSDEEARVMAHLAKAHLAEVGTFIARTSTEVHGGMGMTDLLGLHYWFKRVGVNRQLFGSPEAAREDAARAQRWV